VFLAVLLTTRWFKIARPSQNFPRGYLEWLKVNSS